MCNLQLRNTIRLFYYSLFLFVFRDLKLHVNSNKLLLISSFIICVSKLFLIAKLLKLEIINRIIKFTWSRHFNLWINFYKICSKPKIKTILWTYTIHPSKVEFKNLSSSISLKIFIFNRAAINILLLIFFPSLCTILL